MAIAPGADILAEDVLDGLDEAGGLKAAKTSNTTRTSTTTLAADPDLSLSVLANTVYRVAALLVFTSGTTPDFKFDLSGPTGFTASLNVATWNMAIVAAASKLADTRMGVEGDAFGIPGNGTTYATERQVSEVSGFLRTSTTAGTCAIRWSQNTSDAGSTILRAGSWFELTPMN